MRTNEEILNEVYAECTRDDCAKRNFVPILAMERAIAECKSEIIAKLLVLSNDCKSASGCYVINKKSLDNLIEIIK